MFTSTSSRSTSPASSSRSAATTASFDSADRTSPLFNPAYQIVSPSPAQAWLERALMWSSATDPLLPDSYRQPVYSLEDSVAILRGQGPASAAVAPASRVASNLSGRRSLLKRCASRMSFRPSSRSSSSSSTRSIKEKKSTEELMQAYGYRVPTFDLDQSVAILRRRRDGSQ